MEASTGGDAGRMEGYPVTSSQQIVRSLLREARTALVFRLRLTLVPSSGFDHSWSTLLGGVKSEGGECFAASAESERDVGWGRVCVFLKRLGKKADSRSNYLILGGMVAALPRLCVLDVSWNWSSLSHATSLTTLRLQACGLTPDSLDALGGSLRCLPSVGELDLSCNKLLAGGLSRLTFHLAHVTHLERLDLHLCCLTRDDLEALIQVLPSFTALTELDVSSNKEVGGVVHPLVSALPVTQMRRLPFNSCYLSNESFTALALAVPYLRTVDISWCKVVGGHLALLLDALQPSVVSELRLCSCELTTDDMQHLAAVCRRGCLSSLRALDLSYNSLVGDNGWCSLFAAGGLGSLEDVDRWTADCQEREQLRYCLKKRSVLLEWDPDLQDTSSACKGNSQESLEESQPEE
ncbi:NLR family CARD domain-containing protein 3 [Sarotherodon galilaeus]